MASFPFSHPESSLAIAKLITLLVISCLLIESILL